MSKDKRPVATKFFDGNTSEQGAQASYGENYSLVKRNNQVFICGNRCGHDPHAPRFYNPNYKKQPAPIEIAVRNIEDYYYSPRKYLPRLLRIRQSRSERRESCAALIQVILRATNLLTMCIGLSKPPTIAALAKRAGCSLRRAYRTLKPLIEAGYIEVFRQKAIKKENGGFKSIAAVRKISPFLFIDLGVDNFLLHQTIGFLRKKMEIGNRSSIIPKPLKISNVFKKCLTRTPKEEAAQARREAAMKQEAEKICQLIADGMPADKAISLVRGQPP